MEILTILEEFETVNSVDLFETVFNGDEQIGEDTETGRAQSTDFSSQTVIWALDPFSEDPARNMEFAHSLAHLHPNTTICPVYVLSQTLFSELSSDWGYQASGKLKPTVRQALDEYLKQFAFLEMSQPKILIDHSNSRSSAAERLLRFARRTGASSIALRSHRRSGLSRLMTGSFTERLMEQTDLPLTIHGPNAEAVEETPSIVVYPSDFSQTCERSFHQVLKLCQDLGAELHVYHNTGPWESENLSGVQLMSGPWIAPSFGGSIGVFAADAPAALSIDEQLRHKTQLCADLAEDAGVRMRYVRKNSRESTAEGIVGYVSGLSRRTRHDRHSDRTASGLPANGLTSVLVAMVSQTGLVSSLLLGSVTRDVIRESPCPVYVLPRDPKQ